MACMRINTLIFYLTIVSVFFSMTQGARILLVPWPFASHVSEIVNIGEGLVARGHEVHAITSPTFSDLNKFNKKVNFILYHITDPDFYQITDDKKMAEFTELLTEITLKTDFRTSIDGYREMCTNPLKDQKLFEQLKSMKFDLAVVDSFPMGRCTLVLMHRLGLPHVSIQTTDEPWLLRNPALPSAWPTNLGENAYTEKMNFWERLDNLRALVDWVALPGISYMEDDFLKEFFYETAPVPLNKLAGKSLLWLLEYNPVMDYARPKMANEVHIGGLTTKPAKPLNKDLEKFMNSNPEGVVVASFGSLASFLPKRALDALIGAFKQVKYNVIMRYPMTPPSDLPKNIRLESWLPQNDLLGHNNTKLFITHCGANGQNEALYHGVPMVGLPVFAEQPYNAKRMAYHGYGVELDFSSFTADDLTKAMNDVIGNKSYYDNICHAAEIFKDQPMTPKETALFWIEHVIKYGGAHMRSHALDMPWYEYLMLDILAFVLGVLLVCVIIVIWAIKKLLSMFKVSAEKVKSE